MHHTPSKHFRKREFYSKTYLQTTTGGQTLLTNSHSRSGEVVQIWCTCLLLDAVNIDKNLIWGVFWCQPESSNHCVSPLFQILQRLLPQTEISVAMGRQSYIKTWSDIMWGKNITLSRLRNANVWRPNCWGSHHQKQRIGVKNISWRKMIFMPRINVIHQT